MKTKKFIQYVMLLMSLAVLFSPGCKDDDETEPPPAAPADLEAVAIMATAVDLQWGDNANNETGFRLERKDSDSLDFRLIKDLTAETTTFSDTKLNPGTVYQYRIMAYTAAGESGYSNILKVTTLSVAPNKPLELKLKVVSFDQIDLSWTDDSDNETGFKVERAMGSSNQFEELVDLSKDTTTYQDKGLSPNTLYHYRILAYNSVGNSEYSNTASDTTGIDALQPPTNLAANGISVDEIDLTWEDNNSDETGFILERAANKSTVFIEIADLVANSTAYKDSGLFPDTYYTYRIKTYNTFQQSGYSDTLSVKTDNVAPIAPTNLVATPSTLQVRLDWEDNSANELGFIIEATGGETVFSRFDTISSNITSYVDDNLSIGTVYEYRVSAYNTGGNSDHSNIVQATTPTFQTATANALFSARYAYTTAVFDNKLWVIAGWDGTQKRDVWYSTDGVSWTEATSSAAFPARYFHTVAVFDNKLWVIGGRDKDRNLKNDVWYSTDGATWVQATSSAPFSGRDGHTTAVLDNKLWVIGGWDGTGKNDVWYSTDGVLWTEATSSAAFPARWYHTIAVFDNRLWVIGGVANKNDVWYSTDGVSWTEATSSAPFSGRSGHTTAVFDNKLWVIGGTIGANFYKNDVWYSMNGVDWMEATSSAPFSARFGHAAAVFDKRLWVTGGWEGAYKNDIWFLP